MRKLKLFFCLLPLLFVGCFDLGGDHEQCDMCDGDDFCMHECMDSEHDGWGSVGHIRSASRGQH